MLHILAMQSSILLRATAIIALTASAPAMAQTAPVVEAEAEPGPLTVQAESLGPVINRDIFGQFAEHLGTGIYGGVWVGKGSKIPNVRGIRSDVVGALKAIKVPVVRWPGGCFADEYHWRDAIGPVAKRKTTVNSVWAGAVEPNSFGTHEFMDFAEQIGSEAYVSVNMGSGTVQEAADWLEYMTAVAPATAAKERAANGSKAPFKVKYLGLGNEMWGCGGPNTPDEYVTKMKGFAHFIHNYNPDQAAPKIDFSAIAKDLMSGKPMDSLPSNPNGMKRIAAGPNSADPSYTEVIMKAWKARSPIYWDINGISLHQYTWGSMPFNEPASGFAEKDYAMVLMQTQWMDRTLTKHSEIMDKYDPKKHVALVVDEWGVWLKPKAGTEQMFLQQDQSLRDGMAAAMNINIFARHADRVRMSNIAQMVNVLQAMIVTEGPKMVLTPTYHVYKMYVPFQDATLLPITFNTGVYKIDKIILPKVDAIAAKGKDGNVWLALINLDPNNSTNVTANVPGIAATSAVGEMLTAASFNTINNFESPNAVTPKSFNAKAENGKLVLRLAPHSVTVVQLQP
jgi:alpha-L-arabinofuranosidase